MTTTSSGAAAITTTTSGTLAPTAPAPPTAVHKEGYFTAAYVIVFGGILLYLISIARRFPARRSGGASTPRS